MDRFLQLYGNSETINIFVDPEQQQSQQSSESDPRSRRPASPPPWKRRYVEVIFFNLQLFRYISKDLMSQLFDLVLDIKGPYVAVV